MATVSDSARVLVVGGGAMGGVLAASLAGTVERLVVLDNAAEHVALMRDPGLRIAGPDGRERPVALDARTSVAELDRDFDFALVTVKAPRIEPALRPLAESHRVGAYVSLGNGMVQELVAAVVGAEATIGGVMEFGATNLGPGRIQLTRPGAVVVGELDGQVRERTRRLVAAIGAVAGLELTRDLHSRIWSKLLINTTLAGLSAVSGLRTGGIAASRDGLAAAAAVWSEGYAVALAHGAVLMPSFGYEARDLVPAEVGPRAAAAAIAVALEQTKGVRPSMLQDLEAGRPTEVDVINGAVAARARAVGLPSAANERVTALVHEIEAGRRPSSPAHLTEVAAATAAPIG